MPRRFHTLDAMRGIAAISVVVLHLCQQYSYKPEPYSFLAVDFFFMLSGFILTITFEPRFKFALSPQSFMALRVARLYPMFFLGAALGAVTLFGQNLYHTGHSMSPMASFVTIALNLVAVPSPINNYLFPINPPGWSLFFEFMINGIFAVIFWKWSTGALAKLLCVAAALFLGLIYFYSDGDAGIGWTTFVNGIIRIFFCFLLGVMLARLAPGESRPSYLAIVLLIIFAALLAIPINGRPSVTLNIAAVFIILPALLWLGIKWQMPRQLVWISGAFGDLSYPLYAVHFPAMRIFTFGARQGHMPGLQTAAIFLIAIIPVAWCLARFVDGPVRRSMGKIHRPWSIMLRA